jgi:hypothetical protein
MTPPVDSAGLARDALERVCSGSDPSAAVGVYSRDFHDHVNAAEHRGHEGIRRSLGSTSSSSATATFAFTWRIR